MFSIINVPDEEKKRRRQLTDFAVKLALLAAGVGLILELFYYLFVLSPEQRVSDMEFRLMIAVTTAAVGLLTMMLGINRSKVIPYWLSSSIFLLAFIFLALFSDTPGEVMNGRSTMFFMVPILLSGVLIHSYATFIFTTIVTFIFATYTTGTPGAHVNPLNIIFFYFFSGLVSIVLRSLEKSTSQLRREAA